MLAGGAGAGARWWQQQKTQELQGPPPSPVAKENTRAESLALKGDYDGAHETINNALADPNLSAQAKHDLYLQQGVTYENQKDYDAAMESYRKAESIKETADVMQAIARMAEMKQDVALAVTYYKKAIPLIPEDEVMKESLKKYYENKIIVLQGGQPNYE